MNKAKWDLSPVTYQVLGVGLLVLFFLTLPVYIGQAFQNPSLDTLWPLMCLAPGTFAMAAGMLLRGTLGKHKN